MIAEGRYRLSGFSVEGVDKIHRAHDDPAIFVVGAAPIGKASAWLSANNTGIGFPLQFAGRGIESEDLLRRRDRVKNSSYLDRAGLQTASLSGVIGPCNFKLFYIRFIDLALRGVVGVS